MRSIRSPSKSRWNKRSSSTITTLAVRMTPAPPSRAEMTSRRPPASVERAKGGLFGSKASRITSSLHSLPQASTRAASPRFSLSSGSKISTDRPAAICPRPAAISVAVLPDWTLPRIVTCSSSGSSMASSTSPHGGEAMRNGRPARGPSATTRLRRDQRRSALIRPGASVAVRLDMLPSPARRSRRWLRRRPVYPRGRCPTGSPLE